MVKVKRRNELHKAIVNNKAAKMNILIYGAGILVRL